MSHTRIPDVELFRRWLEGVAVGRLISDTKVRDARLLDGISARELERRLVGRRVCTTGRHGKHLIAGLDDGNALILHFGMTGTIDRDLGRHSGVTTIRGAHRAGQRPLGVRHFTTRARAHLAD